MASSARAQPRNVDCQVELSLPCAAGPAEVAGDLRMAVAALRSDCAAAGIRLEATPVDVRPVEALPLQLTTSRYLEMQQHLDTIGPAGRRMMRATASTQVCPDWWPGAAGAEQWRPTAWADDGIIEAVE